MNPWQQVEFNYPAIPSMITDEEKVYLYWLASSVWTAEGHIVEIGPWLGGSTASLAAGMRRNTNNTDRKLHVFDNFIWRGFMSQRASLPLKEGDSFETYFLENVKEYKDFIVTHKRSLPDEAIPSDRLAMEIRDVNPDGSELLKWEPEEPVEILFIDGAKSWSGLKYLLDELSGGLIPGKSLLVCQDYKYWGSYWVPLILEMLQEHLELVHNLKFNTVTFRLTSPLDTKKVRSLSNLSNTISVALGLEHLETASRRLATINDRLGAAILQTCKVRFLAHKGEMEKALEAYREVESQWPFGGDALNLERARLWLEEQVGTLVRPSLRRRLQRLLELGWRIGRRMKRKIQASFSAASRIRKVPR